MDNFYQQNINLLKKQYTGYADRLIQDMEQANIDASCYQGNTISKNNYPVLCFLNGRAFYSLYDPIKDANNFASELIHKNPSSHFFVVAGLANGYHILPLLAQGKTVLAVEANIATIKKIYTECSLESLLNQQNFFITTIQDLGANLLLLYRPALHGTFVFSQYRSWTLNNPEHSNKTAEIIQHCLGQISADYSVQAHFGKVWMRNFFRNIMFVKNNSSSPLIAQTLQFPIHKTAIVIAAGPSLDRQLPYLKNNRENLYLIATDTALQVLHKQNIVPDAVTSIDGQNISWQHFTSGLTEDLLVILDYTSHPLIAELAMQKKCKIFFFPGGHPLCRLLVKFTNQNLPQKKEMFLDTNSGTVTMTAIDFAVQSGFKQIGVVGADFSYLGAKPYCRGTYLEHRLSNNSNRLQPIDTPYSQLMFRTALVRNTQGIPSTKVLLSYEEYFNSYSEKMLENNIFIYKLSEKHVIMQDNDNKLQETLKNSIECADFIVWLKRELYKNAEAVLPDIVTALLPFAAWCEKHSLYVSGTDSFAKIVYLAQKISKQYMGEYYVE